MAAYDWGKGLVKGFFWGGLIGVVVGILITTRRGQGTWEDIGKSADALVDKTKEQIGQARRKMEERANLGQNLDRGEQEGPKGTGAPKL